MRGARAMATWEVELNKRWRAGPGTFELDVAFRCEAERVVLYGPSGAGKTQTLRMIAGITHADAGHVRVAGRTLQDSAARIDLKPQQRRIGCVFQDHALFAHLTVRQNIAFALQRGWRNPSRHAASPEADRWVERFGLQAVAHHHPHQVSGGQRQRTALARALVHAPSALLLDEPFASLDPALRVRLREELLELQAALRIPMLLITHDEADVRSLAQQVVHLEAGRVVGG